MSTFDPTTLPFLQEIPCDPSLLFWTQTTTLDGASYLLTFRYNAREACYYLTIESPDGSTSYVGGLKLVCGVFLLQQFATPPGELMVITGSTNDSPPALGDLAAGARCTLLYVPEAVLFSPGSTADLQRFPGFVVT